MICAVVVNYNSAADTAKCVAALNESNTEVHVVVVDNGSTESLVPFDGAEFVRLSTNIGYGRANNIGIRNALENTNCDFIFIINPDAFVQPCALSNLESFLDTSPGYGVACPKILFSDEPQQLWYGGGEMSWGRGSASIPGYRESADLPMANTSRMVTFATGCAMLIRRDVIERVGGFDQRFFMYEEDVEFSLRILNAGYQIGYCHSAVVHHRVQGSIRKEEPFFSLISPLNPNLPFYIYHITRNRLLNISTHATFSQKVRFIFGFVVRWILMVGSFMLKGRWDGVFAVGKGVIDFLKARAIPFRNEVFDDCTN